MEISSPGTRNLTRNIDVSSPGVRNCIRNFVGTPERGMRPACSQDGGRSVGARRRQTVGAGAPPWSSGEFEETRGAAGGRDGSPICQLVVRKFCEGLCGSPSHMAQAGQQGVRRSLGEVRVDDDKINVLAAGLPEMTQLTGRKTNNPPFGHLTQELEAAAAGFGISQGDDPAPCPNDSGDVSRDGTGIASTESSALMGSVDESIGEAHVPDLPQPMLDGLKPQRGAKERSVFFPEPPENAAGRTYHKGHYAIWTPRAASYRVRASVGGA